MILCDICDDHHSARRHLKFELMDENSNKKILASTSYVIDLCDNCVGKIDDLCYVKNGIAIHDLFRKELI